MADKHSGWIVSLSNGQTVFETEPEPGQMSAWQALLRRLQLENLRITQIRLQHNGQTVVGIPHAYHYVQCYQQSKAMFSGKEVTVQGIGSVEGAVVFMNWMNESGTVWQDIRSVQEMRVHSTIDWQKVI